MFGFFKLKLYGLIAALFAGLMAVIYAMGSKSAKGKHMKERLDAMKHKEEIEDEVDNRDDDELVSGIVRKRR